MTKYENYEVHQPIFVRDDRGEVTELIWIRHVGRRRKLRVERTTDAGEARRIAEKLEGGE